MHGGARPYLPEYLADAALDKDTMKSRQMEISETELNDNLFLCDVVPYSVVMHVFPTDSLSNRFGRERLNLAVKESRYLTSKIVDAKSTGGADNVLMKQLGTSFYTLVSSWCDFAGRSPSCDKITFDEFDAANPKSEQVFSESTSHSELGVKHRISTPTMPRTLIHGRFLSGSQHTWHYKCSCGWEGQIEWPDCILGVPAGKRSEDFFAGPGDKWYFGCPKCGLPMDRSVHLNATQGHHGGHWIPLNPSVLPRRSSWKISQTMAPWISAQKLKDKRDDFRFENQWRNEVLGEPFVSEDVTLTEEMVFQCCNEDLGWVDGSRGPWTHGRVACGVDWGDVSWFVARGPYEGRSRLLYIEMIDAKNPLEHPKRVAELFKILGGELLVCDAGYGRDRNQMLFNWFPGKVFSCFYPSSEMGSKVYRPAWQPKQAKVTVHRTSHLKLVCHEIITHQLDLPYRCDRLIPFAQHHANLQLIKTYDPDRDTTRETMAASGPDHFAHANGYAMLAEERVTGLTKRALVVA
ncbi:MAG: phage terminase large subunit family protein [Candidatus Eisenbacteria sp.]|nr:phage terminase large subunit family protein [Candidatus Eisenbacteria bacterium]